MNPVMRRWLAAGFLALVANSLYLLVFASPTIFYMGQVLVHLGLGVILLAGFLWLLFRSPEFRSTCRWAAFCLLPATALGGFLVWKGALREHRWALYAHILLAAAGTLLVWRAFRWGLLGRVGFAGSVLAALGLLYGLLSPSDLRAIRNPHYIPASMEEEGGGPQSPFWPSSANTSTGKPVPANFFMDSKRCGECHRDIYRQWESSMHHFASFNNQFYRKSIEHMQEISGTQGSKWCAGCHDHALLFSGRFDTPVREQLNTREAHAGLGCVSCHSIVHVNGSMGQGGFTIEYPPLHELASSTNPYLRALDNFLTKVEPEPHRRTFLKPFMRNSPAEFCSACHKVHLDVPVNNYRWLRGFNDYDNWQASGVSGQGARSFYYPEKPSTCADCHMPLVPSRDPGHRNGKVHDHRFAAANTAVPFVNGDEAQLSAVKGFLQSGFITVDIFAASPAETAPGLQMLRRSGETPQQLMSTFAVGEEAETGGQFFLRQVGKVAAPLNIVQPALAPGSEARVSVVVRTRKIGHFFPGGTVDAFDVWLELKAEDAGGRTIFWSGRVEDEGRGPVDPGAHFYRSYMLDGDGNPINKRNAWQARSLLYVRLIPPGAADVVHYRLRIPSDARGPIKLTAKLNHRKFSHYYTQFAYAGTAKPGQDPLRVSVHYDSREYTFRPEDIPPNVPGRFRKEIPVLPIVTLAQDKVQLPLAAPGEPTRWEPLPRRSERERWNDWGIGLLLQGDLKGAEYAFLRVTEVDPDYADGWLNVARTLIQEGETEAAKPFLAKALELQPRLARAHFFQAMVHKADGDYEAALASLQTVVSQYPRDRVAQNQRGRLLFLQRRYEEAIAAFRKVLDVDPEDVQAHYNLMLSYRGAGQAEKARHHEKLFRRFKADESSQALTARIRQLNPEDNNERQGIHEHLSAPLP